MEDSSKTKYKAHVAILYHKSNKYIVRKMMRTLSPFRVA